MGKLDRARAKSVVPVTFPALAKMLRSMAGAASSGVKRQWFLEAANMCDRAPSTLTSHITVEQEPHDRNR